jgi:hypothetical protein
MAPDLIFLNQPPVWIKILHPNYAQLAKRVSGKWVHHDNPQRLNVIAQDLSHLIIGGLATEIKYRPSLNDPKGRFSHLLPPICIYALPENKDRLYEKIRIYGLPDVYWQSNEATRKLHGLVKQ